MEVGVGSRGVQAEEDATDLEDGLERRRGKVGRVPEVSRTSADSR